MRDSEFGPSGCAICGFPRSSHYFSHAFALPVQAEILARMLKRRELRQNPDLRDKPPMVALHLGHRLRLCQPLFFGAARAGCAATAPATRFAPAAPSTGTP